MTTRSDDAVDTDPPGLDLAAFGEYFAAACPGQVTGPLRARLLTGGRSNLTYEVTDGTTEWVVRRPPLGHVLATAHDMAREYRVISALSATEVPVPDTYTLCESPDVIGAPWYVMAKVPGTVYRSDRDLAPVGPERTRGIARAMIEVMVRLHRVDPAAVGLGDLGRPQGYLERQVRRWRKQIDASHSRELRGMVDLHDRLLGALPAESDTAIVHGDYRLDNLVVDAEDRVAGVLDWEMATQGDPLADLGLLAAYQRMAQAGFGTGIPESNGTPGFPSAEQIVADYAELSGRDLSHLGGYVGLAFFKIAAIFEGIHYRYLQGKTVGEGFADIGTAVEPVLAMGLAALEESG